jgi:Cys-tRNA(Pro) deacylase
MAKEKMPVTPAIRFLREQQVLFTDHLYAYEERGGTAVSSRELGIDEYAVIKTLVMEDESREPLIVLMHGNRQVSTKELARILGKKFVHPCSPETAAKHTGYLVGGTSPFGCRRQLSVCIEESILALPKIYLNGGKRGYLVGIESHELVRLLAPTLVNVAI